MFAIALLLGILIVSIVVATVRTIRMDGYGPRPTEMWNSHLEPVAANDTHTTRLA